MNGLVTGAGSEQSFAISANGLDSDSRAFVFAPHTGGTILDAFGFAIYAHPLCTLADDTWHGSPSPITPAPPVVLTLFP